MLDRCSSLSYHNQSPVYVATMVRFRFKGSKPARGRRGNPKHNDDSNEWIIEKTLTQGSGGTCYLLKSKVTGGRLVQKVIAAEFRLRNNEVSTETRP